MKNTNEKRTFIDSLNDALSGIIEAIIHERNIKIDFVFAVLAILMSLLLGFDRKEIIIVCIMIGVVMAAEMINTAIENLADVVTTEQNPKIKKVKDTSAGAVLIVAFTSLIVAYGLAFDKLDPLVRHSLNIVTDLPLHVSAGILLVVVLTVIFFKAITKKGTYLRGGMPSGHAAVAATSVMIIWYLTNNTVVLLITMVLAVLVIHSRVEAKIHTLFESVLGIILGMVIALVVFGILKLFLVM